MTKATVETPYTLRSIERMLGLNRSVISSIIHAGFVSPARGARNEYRFSFQDVVLLRTAYHLMEAKISSRRMLRSLKMLRAKLPEELPLSGLRIAAVGNEVVVRDGDSRWDAETGQLLMDFEIAADGDAVKFSSREPCAQEAGAENSAEWFARAQNLENDDARGAEQAYRRTLELAPDHADAYLNLGALLCEAGRCREAVALYDVAIGHCPDVPLLHFNRAIALEDLNKVKEALRSYERCLELAPQLADAHYNAARLHELRGEKQKALRHYSAYRRLQQ